ncbi:MAG: hypothetical protein IT326_04415, partial [Anaerolineae bacterium]|nr:hypothetical protein [Anaerolineae bacterium]
MRNRTLRLIVVPGMLALAVLACNMPGTGGAPTETPSPVPTLDEAAMITLTPATPTPTTAPPPTATPNNAPPTATATSLPGVTPSATSCTYNASFVTDVNVPDGTVIAPGQQFDKTWRMKSEGCAAWPSGTQLTFVRGDQMGGANVSVSAPAIGGTTDITVRFTAPTAPGTYRSFWQLQGGGVRFGTEIYVEIKVEGTAATAAPTAVPTGSGSSDVTITTVAWNSALAFEANSFNVIVTIKNQGTGNAPAFDAKAEFQGQSAVTKQVPALAAGASYDLVIPVTYATKGTYSYTFTLDPANTVSESNEGNNAYSSSGSGAPVLKVYKLTVDKVGNTTMAASSCFDIDAGAAAACGSADISWSSLSRLESF